MDQLSFRGRVLRLNPFFAAPLCGRGLRRSVSCAAVLVMFFAISLTACGGTATSMHLRKTEGTVAVSDGEGKEVEPREDLGLYSGYQVGTESKSYGWIDLDKVKLTKLDENSEVEIRKSGKELELVVSRGSLYFDITEPLDEDEQLTIRSATMVTAIRGTSGWVTVESGDSMSVWILEGTVECSVQDGQGNALVTESVTAWERAQMDLADKEIVKDAFAEDDIPGFIRTERGLPEVNAYGARIFELRDNYLNYYAMPADFQTAVRNAAEGLENRDRGLLAETVTMDAFSPYTRVSEGYGGMQILEFYTKYEDRKFFVRVEHESGGGDLGEAVFFELELRPENGTGMSCRAEIDYDPDGTTNFWRFSWVSCPCADWQMEGQAEVLMEENASGGDAVELSGRQTGMIVHNLRDGIWTGMAAFGDEETSYEQGHKQGDSSVPPEIVFNALDTGKSADDLNIYW